MKRSQRCNSDYSFYNFNLSQFKKQYFKLIKSLDNYVFHSMIISIGDIVKNQLESEGKVYTVGDKVFKKSGKPFKSQNKINTIKEITINPNTNLEAFSFEEDESIVDVRQLDKE
jgi:hypothetical protein